MRVISGKFRGKKLQTPSGLSTRPTADRAKEAIFNVLNSLIDFSGTQIADVFAGSGALGIEALSRGAKSCLFIENNKEAIHAIKNNLISINMLNNSAFLNDYNSIEHSKFSPFDVIFLDPPYNKGLIPLALQSLLNSNLINSKTIIVAETDNLETLNLPKELTEIKSKKYGKAKVTFLQYNSL